MSDSVIKLHPLAQVLDELPGDEAVAVVLMMALGSDEDKAKLAAAFEQQAKKP